jgi:hypothetical protein
MKMPDRILRTELLLSEAWLSLKDNADRCCWIAVFLTADTLGDLPAGPHRLVHLWRPYGVDSTEKAAQTLSHLADVGLVIPYTVSSKIYLRIPKFGQSRRFMGRLWPIPAWASDQDKQAFAKKALESLKSTPENLGGPPIGVGVGVGVREVQNLKTGVKGLVVPTLTRANEHPPQTQPDNPILEIGKTIQKLTLPATRKSPQDIEAERARQLAYVAAQTKDKTP